MSIRIHFHRRSFRACTLLLSLTSALLSATAAGAGPFTDVGYPPGAMNAWATSTTQLVRGPLDIASPELGSASFGLATNVLGVATGDSASTLSLGDGGTVTVYLDSGISNGPNDDFAVFENGFFDLFGLFGELAYVEVASDGIHFARFEVDAVNTFPVTSFDTLDPTDYFGLAGRHPAGQGTGFDLADLAFDPLVESGAVDLIDIRYVRVIDVIGDGSTHDSNANPIFDPYPTAFPVGGFDLDAIGAIHLPEPALASGLVAGIFFLLLATRLPIPKRFMAVVPATLGAAFALASPASALIATFEDLGLASESVENGSSLPGSFTSGGITFQNDYFPSYNGFSGFAYSSTTDTTTPGFGNQFSSITGSGAGGSDTYGIFYSSGRLTLPSAQIVLGANLTNTTYAYLSMLTGDTFAKTFGGPTGTDPDYFRILIEGLDDSGTSTGIVEFLLSDFQSSNSSEDYIVADWSWVDLTGLGAVRELSFSFESSDQSGGFINTPTYFAIDNVTTIPEPGTALLLGLGLAVLTRVSQPRR